MSGAAAAVLCLSSGYRPSEASSSLDDTACFDGSPVPADRCSSAAPSQQQPGSSTAGSSSRSKRRSKRSSSSGSSGVWPFSKLKRRHKRMLAEAAQLVAGALTSMLVALGIVLLLQRVMQVSRSSSNLDSLSAVQPLMTPIAETIYVCSSVPQVDLQHQHVLTWRWRQAV
eukprot:GHRQ01035160.1.p1 GENE.GHRQ01035160.1~~GHRQ01035160.1.p1  ORF type:complete len:170 (+),score=57.57 GHRQ01035160.1:1096-1605(+)